MPTPRLGTQFCGHTSVLDLEGHPGDFKTIKRGGPRVIFRTTCFIFNLGSWSCPILQSALSSFLRFVAPIARCGHKLVVVRQSTCLFVGHFRSSAKGRTNDTGRRRFVRRFLWRGRGIVDSDVEVKDQEKTGL